MTHSPHNAEAAGGARKAFEKRIRQIIAEHENNALGHVGVTAEVRAAIRELDRRKPGQGR